MPATWTCTTRAAALAPGRAGDLSGLPPAYIAVAGHDPLRDDGARYAELLAGGRCNGGAATMPKTLVHGYLGYTGWSRRPPRPLKRGLAALRAALQRLTKHKVCRGRSRQATMGPRSLHGGLIHMKTANAAAPGERPGIVLSSLAGATALAVIAAPSAVAAPDCSPQGVSNTSGRNHRAARQYLADHPDANKV